MPFDIRTTEDGITEVIVRDAIGNYVDVSLTINRGILSVVLMVDTVPIAASGEVDIDDFKAALKRLENGE